MARQSHLSGWFCIFAPKFWGASDVICCSVNVDRVVVVLGGGGDTSTLTIVIEIICGRVVGTHNLVQTALTLVTLLCKGSRV